MRQARSSFRTSVPIPALAAVTLAALGLVEHASAQSVPGFTVETFATPPFPQLLAFGADGVLYAGRDDNPGGSADPTFVTRITADGVSLPFGLQAIADPDAVVVDTTGMVSGIANAVLVGGLVTNPGPGRVSIIAPDGAVSTLVEALEYGNISELKIDQDQRLLFVSVSGNAVFAGDPGEMPSFLCATAASPIYLAIAPDGRIFTSSNRGIVAVNAADGTVINSSFVLFQGRASIEFAEGGGFGNGLLALESNSGILYSVSDEGTKTEIGTGFEGCDDLAIGPCGEVYLSCRLEGKVLRISGPPTPDLDGNGSVDGADLGLLLGTWGSNDCAADLNQDGVVDGADLGALLGAWGTPVC